MLLLGFFMSFFQQIDNQDNDKSIDNLCGIKLGSFFQKSKYIMQ